MLLADAVDELTDHQHTCRECQQSYGCRIDGCPMPLDYECEGCWEELEVLATEWRQECRQEREDMAL